MPESLIVRDVKERKSTVTTNPKTQASFSVRYSKAIYITFMVLLLFQLPLQFLATFFKF